MGLLALPYWDWFVSGLKYGDWKAWLILCFILIVVFVIAIFKKK